MNIVQPLAQIEQIVFLVLLVLPFVPVVDAQVFNVVTDHDHAGDDGHTALAHDVEADFEAADAVVLQVHDAAAHDRTQEEAEQVLGRVRKGRAEGLFRLVHGVHHDADHPRHPRRPDEDRHPQVQQQTILLARGHHLELELRRHYRHPHHQSDRLDYRLTSLPAHHVEQVSAAQNAHER